MRTQAIFAALFLGFPGVLSVLSLARVPVRIHYPPGALQEGDLVFRRGPSLLSRIVLAADSESAYSHVGLVGVLDGSPWVIHTSTGESTPPEEGIRVEPLDHFLAPDRAQEAALYRLKPQFRDFAAGGVRQALEYARDQVPFDGEFNLETTGKLYCTELVWRAYLEAGLDLVDGEFQYLNIPFRQSLYLLPSDLLNSPKLRRIHETENEHPDLPPVVDHRPGGG